MDFEVGMKAVTWAGDIVTIKKISPSHCCFLVVDGQGRCFEVSSEELFHARKDLEHFPGIGWFISVDKEI